ncbi:cell division protein CrgA [Calidifontibacter terrae]
MSKSSKKPTDENSEGITPDEAVSSEQAEADDAGTLGIKKKSKAQRDAEKQEAADEEQREALRRRTPQAVKLESGENPRWWVPTMLSLMVAGLVWLVVTYLSRGNYYPVPALKNWNLGVGFVLIMAGFVMTTRWK